MKFTKKCDSTQNKIRISNKRRSSAGMFYTSSAGAVTSLILMFVFSLTGTTNLFGLNGSAYADYTLSMTSSGAQSIDVAPSSSGIGTSIGEDAITVSTTCRSGYNLSMSTSVNDNKLYLDGNSSSGSYFSPVDGTSPLANSTNKWGYYFNDSSTAPTPSNVFSAIPALGSTAVIKSPLPTPSSTDIEDSFSIYYGVGVNSNLTPGTYKMKPDTNNSNADGTIIYYLTLANACLPRTYMQDVTEADLAELMPDDGDSTTLYDKRDDSDYQITKINDNYWMTQNLRITHTTGQPVGTILAENSNFSSNLTFNGDLTAGNSYTAKRYHIPTETDLSTLGLTANQVGVWYNYCAASAGTVCNNTEAKDATEDICPAGWRLPTSTEFSGITSSVNTFSPVAGGYYYSGALTATSTGHWSSTADTSGFTKQYLLVYKNSALLVSSDNKRAGLKIRCIYQPPEPDPCEGHENELYCKVKAMSKGKQTLAQLRAAITTDNSGVYEYNTSVFGAASDAASTSKIYYYRGILDNTVGYYGSDGDNAKYPNTVVLSSASSKSGLTTSDTCWRIVRTTGSGGVKMIYQGKWTAAGDSGNCKNSSSNANAVSSVYFNRRLSSSTNNYDTKGRIIYVGYNRSSTSSHQTGTSSFNNSTLFVNGTASNLRTQLESWYNSNMTAWTSKLETSAGWCNDRTTYSSTTTSSKTTSNIPYKTSSATVYFGPYLRNATTNSQPTLGCPNNTGYDLLTTSNGYIGVPSAPITADEAAFAGSGYESSYTPYHANSYLRSGAYFWLLSPGGRYSSGGVFAFRVASSGDLNSIDVSDANGVRPSISLNPGTTAVSGTGTATDPWIVNP